MVNLFRAISIAITDDDSDRLVRKLIRLDRWCKLYEKLFYKNDDKNLITFLRDIFADEDCWQAGPNAFINLRFFANRLLDTKNHFTAEDRYLIACQYCLIDRIPYLFQIIFNNHKLKYYGEDAKEDDLKICRLLLKQYNVDDSMRGFWSQLVNINTSTLKNYLVEDGFRYAIDNNCSEAIEYFHKMFMQQGKSVVLIDQFHLKLMYNKFEYPPFTNPHVEAMIEFSWNVMTRKRKLILIERFKKEVPECRNNLLIALLSSGCFVEFKYCFDNYLHDTNIKEMEYFELLEVLIDMFSISKPVQMICRELFQWVWKHKLGQQFWTNTDMPTNIYFILVGIIFDLQRTHKFDGPEMYATLLNEYAIILRYLTNEQIIHWQSNLIEKMDLKYHEYAKEKVWTISLLNVIDNVFKVARKMVARH